MGLREICLNIQGFLDLKNQACVAQWQMRWFLQNGSMHWKARDLRDLRNDEDRRRHMLILLNLRAARRRLLRGSAKVIPFRRVKG
jgi:hypothetical protein